MSSASATPVLDTKRGKKVEIVFAYSSYLWGAAFWYRQLWAESRLDPTECVHRLAQLALPGRLLTADLAERGIVAQPE